MISKHELLIVVNTFNDLETIKVTLPTIIEEAKTASVKVLIHDCSTKAREPIWAWLMAFAAENDVFLMLTSRLSLGDARNLGVKTGMELFCPDYICVLEDDHGLKPGLIKALLAAMKTHYAQPAPNGHLFGLFSGCPKCWAPPFYTIRMEDGDSYPAPEVEPLKLGGANSCFRAAPTSHWVNILKGYDSDLYNISYWQTMNLNLRNYHNGFTTRYIADGDLVFVVDREGQGSTRPIEKREWDPGYAKSDARSRFAGES